MNSGDLCNRAPIITAWGLGPAQGPQKLTAFKVCLVHSKPPGRRETGELEICLGEKRDESQ